MLAAVLRKLYMFEQFEQPPDVSTGLGPELNTFEQFFSDGHRMSLAEGGLCTVGNYADSGRGGSLARRQGL